jgi:hypothetical protein
VASFYWSVSVRVDQGYGALDLMKIGWPRLNDIASLSDLIRSIRCRSDGQKKRRGRRGYLLGFRQEFLWPGLQVLSSGGVLVLSGR